MADFKVTYTTGAQDAVTADQFRESGEWIVFQAENRDDVIVSAHAVQHIERTDAPPSPAFPRALFRWACGAVLLIVFVFSLFLGLVDMFSAGTVTARVFAAALVATGALCARGMRGLERNDRTGIRWAFTGAGAAAAVAVVVLGVERAGYGGAALLRIAGVGVVVAAFACAGVLYKAGARMLLPQAFRTLLTVGAMVGLVQFWYTTEYVTAKRDAGLNQVVELAASEPPASGGTPEYVTATVKMKNLSGTRIRIVATYFDLHEVLEEKLGKQIHQGHLELGPGRWLIPDQEYVETIVIKVSPAAPSVVRFGVSVHVVKGNRVAGLKRVGDCTDMDARCAWELEETSRLNRLTRGARYLVRDHVGGPLVTCVLRKQAPCPRLLEEGTAATEAEKDAATRDVERAQKLGDLYGQVSVGATARLALPAKPAAAPVSTAPPLPAGAPGATAPAPSGSPP